MTKPIRVLVADDHPVVRQGVIGMLGSDPELEIVGEATHGVEAVELAQRLEPDVVLMDLQMPGLSGIAATKEIKSKRPDTHVLMLTTYDTDADVLGAIEAGATGYVLKDSTYEDLCRAVHAVARGEPALAPTVAERLMERMRRPVTEALTARELEVLELVARGATNSEIGTQLYVSTTTVKAHLAHIFRKLAVGDRTEAVTVALERGIIRLARS